MEFYANRTSKIKKFTSTLLLYKCILRGATNTLLRKNINFQLSYIFLEYLCHRLQRLLDQSLTCVLVEHKFIREMSATKVPKQTLSDEYIDYESCILVDISIFEKLQSTWCYVCAKCSKKKYKLRILPITSDFSKNWIFVPETVYFNLQNIFQSKELEDSVLLLPSKNVGFAEEARISLITHPYNCTNEIVDAMLKDYFSVARHLHTNDVFQINMIEHSLYHVYSSGLPSDLTLYFTVNSLKSNCNDKHCDIDGCYVVSEVSELVLEAAVHSYIPQTRSETFTEFNHPFAEPTQHLISCITPFTTKDIKSCIRPLFLLRGPQGSGKRCVVYNASKNLGLHFIHTNFAMIQAPTSAQTEAKLRITLQNAQKCVPCILYLSNIQVFGKTPEGKKDDRVISAFATEIAALYEATQQKFPLIIVASAEETDVPAELQRMFTETIHMTPLDEEKRVHLTLSLLQVKRCIVDTDLYLPLALERCTDFRYEDLQALVLNAIKAQVRSIPRNRQFTILQKDFNCASEYMRMIKSKSENAPRVPKVYWDHIGGLTELKTEIHNRIQVPLLNEFGFGQSGLLLYGPPGTGKTLLAKAIATEYRFRFLSVKGPEMLNMYVGQSEKNIREIFERARSASPCIIFFDELDSLAPNRGRNGDSGGVMDRVVSQLLAEMDGIEESSGVLIVGATNRPDLIDPALLRPGRFDKLFYVGFYTDYWSKLNVLQAQTREFLFQKNGRELTSIINRLPDKVTGADLYFVSSNAWLNAVRETLTKRKKMKKSDKDAPAEEAKKTETDRDTSTAEMSEIIQVKLHHFLDAIRELVPSVSSEDMKRYDEMRKQFS